MGIWLRIALYLQIILGNMATLMILIVQIPEYNISFHFYEPVYSLSRITFNSKYQNLLDICHAFSHVLLTIIVFLKDPLSIISANTGIKA